MTNKQLFEQTGKLVNTPYWIDEIVMEYRVRGASAIEDRFHSTNKTTQGNFISWIWEMMPDIKNPWTLNTFTQIVKRRSSELPVQWSPPSLRH